MDDLIKRLEKATGPDRQLDADIACHLFGETAHGYWAWQARRPKGTNKKPVRSYWLTYAKNYTGAIDAARALIPDGLFWHVAEGKTRADEPLGGASIIAPNSLDTIAEAEHANVIIALCIAAIKARQATLPPQERGS